MVPIAQVHHQKESIALTCFRFFGQCECTILDGSLGASRCHEGSRNRDRQVGRKSLLRGLVVGVGGTRRSSRPRRCRCSWPCLFFGHTAGSVCDRLGLSGVNLLYSWKRKLLAQGGPAAVGLEARVRQLEAELRRVARERDIPPCQIARLRSTALSIFGRDG